MLDLHLQVTYCVHVTGQVPRSLSTFSKERATMCPEQQCARRNIMPGVSYARGRLNWRKYTDTKRIMPIVETNYT